MRTMLLALGAALAFGTFVASLAGSGEPVAFALLLFTIAWLAAVAIAALLLAPVVAIRRARPPAKFVAAALVIGGLIVYPAYSEFYDEAEFAGGGCEGILPLAQLVVTAIGGDQYAPVSYSASCDD